jgi:hypothetical protein
VSEYIKERHGIACECPECERAARLRHEQQDEPRAERWSNIEPDTGLRRHGPL